MRDLSLLLIALIALQWWLGRDNLSGPAPPLNGQLLNQSHTQMQQTQQHHQMVSLSQDYRGAPVLVHFWATWCPICRLEEGSINAIAEDWPVLTVASTSGTMEEVMAYMAENQLDFPVVMDETGAIARQWGLKGVPVSFVIDSEGEIRSVQKGYSTSLGLRFRLWLAGTASGLF